MDYESPDVAKDFPGLFASETTRKGQPHDSDYSDEEKCSRKDLLGKKKDKKEKKDKGYKVFEGESSDDELDEARSPGKSKKTKTSFKFPGKDKKEKHKGKDKDAKEKKDEKEKVCKKESKDSEKVKLKKKKESSFLKLKDRKKKNVDEEAKEENPIFGVPLHTAVERSKSHDGIEIPVFVRELIDYIEEHGLGCERIYRTSGLKSKLQILKNLFNQGEKVYLFEHEPHVVASLLKQFIRDLPDPILTAGLGPKFETAAAIKNPRLRIETIQNLINELPNCNHQLLSWVVVHMTHVISLEKRNKMNLQNVLIALSPAMKISHNLLQAFITDCDVLFGEIELKKYVPPIDFDSSRLSLELPDSPHAIVAELQRQENILNIIHAELNAGLRDPQKEEQLWEIQRVVTQLKRKLRFLRQVEDSASTHPSLSCELQSEQNTAILSDMSLVNQAHSVTIHQQPPNMSQQSHPSLSQQSHPNPHMPEQSLPNNIYLPPPSSMMYQQSPSVKMYKESSSSTLHQQPSSFVEQPSSSIEQSSHIIDQSFPSSIVTMQSPPDSTNQQCLSDSVNQESPIVQISESSTIPLTTKCTDKVKKPVVCETVTSFLSSVSDPVNTKNLPVTFDGGVCKDSDISRNDSISIPKDSFRSFSSSTTKDSAVYPPIQEFQCYRYTDTENEEIKSLALEERMERIKHEELLLVGDELRQKIYAEKLEISKLKAEVYQYIKWRKFRQYRFESTDNSDTPEESSDESVISVVDVEEDMPEILQDFMDDNADTMKMNDDLLKKIIDERDRCVDLKVQLKILLPEERNVQAEHLI